ncbi:MAG: hypothetical protein QGI51_06745 [Dehalococcoidales bacterium]|jgi:hypothetical protein|nr:hypothetical protein [Dehalococcoidales bacterium]
MVIQIFGVILAVVIAVGIIMALRARRGKNDYRPFIRLGIAVIVASLVLMIISLLLQIIFVIGIPILILSLIYLTIGLVSRTRLQSNGR